MTASAKPPTIYASAADLLHGALRSRGWTQARLAQATTTSAKHVSHMLTGRARMSDVFAADCELALQEPGLADRLLVAQAHIDAASAVAALTAVRPC